MPTHLAAGGRDCRVLTESGRQTNLPPNRTQYRVAGGECMGFEARLTKSGNLAIASRNLNSYPKFSQTLTITPARSAKLVHLPPDRNQGHPGRDTREAHRIVDPAAQRGQPTDG